MPTPHNTPVRFDQLGLTTELLQALHETGYETPTPIQAEAIPCLLNGQDLLGHAPTGTGKGKGKNKGRARPKTGKG